MPLIVSHSTLIGLSVILTVGLSVIPRWEDERTSLFADGFRSTGYEQTARQDARSFPRNNYGASGTSPSTPHQGQAGDLQACQAWWFQGLDSSSGEAGGEYGEVLSTSRQGTDGL